MSSSVSEAIGRIDNAQGYLRRVEQALAFARSALHRSQKTSNADPFLIAAAAALTEVRGMSRLVVAAIVSACDTETRQ